MQKLVVVVLLVLVVLLQFCCAVYLPGMPRRVYAKGNEVNVKTRKLSSIRNLPFDFYRVKFCRPKDLQYAAENLGEFLFGDRIENSVYQIKFLEEVTCQKLQTCLDEKCGEDKIECPDLNKEDVEEFIHKIEEDYIAELIVDNLPVANRQDSAHNCGALPPASQAEIEKQEKYTRPDGYPIGCKMYIGDPKNNQKSYFINNHISFVLRYHERDGEFTVVGVEAFPSSIDWGSSYDTCKPGTPVSRVLPKLQLQPETKSIPWSYSIHWAKSDTRWASRWDNYLTTTDSEEFKIHWFSIVNSLMIVLFLTGMVAMIMMRVLHKDIAYYNRADNEDPADETGWKLVHADVFRAPPSSGFLAVLAGSGIQMFCMVVITLVFALLGFLSPANRGSLATVMVLLFVFMGIFAGYYALRFYKMFGGAYWKTVAVATAFFFPGVVFTIFFLINFVMFVAAHSSSGAVPFTSLLSIKAMWLGVSVPLVFLGAYFGWRQEEIKPPVAAHRIPRQIPDQPLYMRAPIAILMGGILPFGAVFIELYFIMSSLWLHKFYYVFGFLFLVFIILILTCAEITIVMTYFQLCNEDYRWWWRAYLTSGSSALYLFLYSAFYFYTKLHVDSHVMAVVFFGYMGIIAFCFFVLTGSIGFFATFAFVRKIYSSIKVD